MAAEVDAVALEHCRRAMVGGDNGSNRSLLCSGHRDSSWLSAYGPAAKPPMIAVMAAPAEELLRTTPIFSRLTAQDRQHIASVSSVKHYGRGEVIFEQESPSDAF